MSDSPRPLPMSQEAHLLQDLSQNLRKAEYGPAEAKDAARHALQAEVDKINSSQAVKNDIDYAFKVAHQTEMNDVIGFQTPKKLAHYPVIEIERDGTIKILPDAKIQADEHQATLQHHKNLHWDATKH